MTNEDIFNRASYNQNSEEDKANAKKYPAFEKYLKAGYSMDQLESKYPNEYKILMDMFTEAAIKSRMCEELLMLNHSFLFDTLITDRDILDLIMIKHQNEFKEFGEKGEEITKKYDELAEEFEASLDV